MCLERPGNVGGGDNKDGNAPVSRRGYELVNSPVLQDEAYGEHESAQSPEHCDGRNLAIISISYP